MTDTIWSDACLAAALAAVDPQTGGLSVRALPGPVRDRFLTVVKTLLPPGTPIRRLPLHIADDRLLGGLDLAATLQAGRPIAAQGILAEADGGLVLVAMAERITPGVAARLAASLDSGEVVAERDGLALRRAAAFSLIALDEGIGDDEHPPAALLDRLAFPVSLTEIGLRDLTEPAHRAPQISRARELLPSVILPDELQDALCAVAVQLGVASLRALLLSIRAARAAAALHGRTEALEEDTMAAARLVLAPRATRLPTEAPPPDQSPEPPPDSPPADASNNPDDADRDDQDDASSRPDQPLGEMLLAAAKAAMPPGLLARLMAGAVKVRTPSIGKAGAVQLSAQRGRPIGVRRGELRAGARLNVIETLRAAAPWQPLRRRTAAAAANGRLYVQPDDVRITRFRQRTETTTIFVVDASGSAALNRLAEAKGAVELVLADCYVRRDRVALISFRGGAAEILLPPTNSLVRAKRSLAGLPGGGGTPLASGLEAAFTLADAVRRKGQSPVVIVLSDGRANVARDGAPGRAHAEEDAIAAGRLLRAAAVPSVLVDTSPRPAPQAKRLAGEMGALYLPLPFAGAEALSRAVISSQNA